MVEFFKAGTASVVVGGQFGSEAKGLVAAHLAITSSSVDVPIISTTNAGAQAGHTTVLDDGRKFVCYHLPTIGVMLSDSRIYINAGSIMDLDLFLQEVHDVCAVTGEDEDHMWARIVVHPQAALISTKHKETEKTGSVRSIGSTQKGVGEALVSKIRRENHSTVGHFRDDVPFRVAMLDLNAMLESGMFAVSIEIPQGTGLSINAGGFFPHCTSRDCWVGQGMTDAGINPKYLGKVAMVCRTFPIRVGNITDEAGATVGYSGDFAAGSLELEWSEFQNVVPERTTVTKRVRRIATWSHDQYLNALRLNRPDIVYLTFTNYLYAHESQDTLENFAYTMRSVERTAGLQPAHVYSWGPRVGQCDRLIYLAAEKSALVASEGV